MTDSIETIVADMQKELDNSVKRKVKVGYEQGYTDGIKDCLFVYMQRLRKVVKRVFKDKLLEAVDNIEEYLAESESEKTRIGYETGYKGGVNQTLQAIKCHLEKIIEELENVQG